MLVSLRPMVCSDSIQVFPWKQGAKERYVFFMKPMEMKTYPNDEAVPYTEENTLEVRTEELMEFFHSLKEQLETYGLLKPHSSEEIVEELRKRVAFLEKITETMCTGAFSSRAVVSEVHI